MSQSNPRTLFGVHSVAPYSRTTGEFYGNFRVLGGSSVNVSSELIKLTGGSSKFPWAVVEGAQSAELAIKVKEFPDFLFELFGGKAPTSSATDAAGAVSTLTNKKGTSLVSATGIATIAVKTANKADLKFGKYVVKVISPTTVHLYLASDIDIARGADGTIQDDSLRVTATPLTITMGGTTDVPDFGLTFTGGASTIAMVVGDTATFEVKPPSLKSMEVVIGGTSDTFPEFGAVVLGARQGDGSMFEVDLFRCKGAGLPLAFEENAFAEPELKAEAFYDSEKNGLMKIRHIIPS